jgi:hypothetical protein
MRIQPEPNKSKTLYTQFAMSHTFCIGCGRSDEQARRDFGGIPLQTHHFIRDHRASEWCVLARCCWREHELAHGHTIRVTGELVLPKLHIGTFMTLKLVRYPEEVDWDRCRQLRGSNLPDFEPIPDWLEEDFRKHRPRDKDRFYTTCTKDI